MSHIAEVYAKDLGVKIGKPTISDHFYPGLPEKYITFQASNKMPSANYLYWDLVVALIKPVLGDIKIVQVGGPKDPKIKGIDYFTLGSSYKQMNYIIKKSKTHVGCDSLPGHIASVYDVPSIVLHFNLYPENSKPLWYNNNSCISLSPDFSENKPSFGPDCKRINEIKPEKIAQAVLDQLKIPKKINFKTVRIGSNFHNETFEIIPNFPSLSPELQGKPINIRGDLYWDTENIVRWCQYSLVNLYTDTCFNPELLRSMPNLKQVVYKYDIEKEVDATNFFKTLKNHKINLIIQPKDKSGISELRLKYFDYNVIDPPESHEKINAMKYISNKRVASEGQIFNSESAYNRLDKSNNFVYDEASSKELESLYLYDEE